MLYCILGNSGVGKSYISSTIVKEFNNIQMLKLYTTRPKRDSELYNADYYFLDDESFSILEKNNLFFETRDYTVKDNSVWRYGTLLHDIEKIKTDDYIIATSKSQFCNYYKSIKDYIIPIVIHADFDTRINRMLSRLGDNETEDEVNRRLTNDVDMIDIDKIPMDFIVFNFEDLEISTISRIRNLIIDFNETGGYRLYGKYLFKNEYTTKLSILYNQLKGDKYEHKTIRRYTEYGNSSSYTS